ncbi:MAG: hypothetical protein LBO72_10740 [Helicobacteraceae bacterium]|jgi:hypothetical protein|nr:hypothetical protein [Helicobacteraceae bacterium]
MSYKTIAIASLIAAALINIAVFYDKFDRIFSKISAFGGFMLIGVFFFIAIFIILCLTRIKDKRLRWISFVFTASFFAFNAAKGYLQEGWTDGGKIIFTSVSGAAAGALILIIAFWIIGKFRKTQV